MPVPFQDRGHGRSMDRIAMTFFYRRHLYSRVTRRIMVHQAR